MATLNITVDDNDATRVRAAYGASTNANLRSMIIADIKAKVVSYEINQAHSDAEAAVRTAQQNVITAGETAKTGAEAINIT